jgi:DNA-binding MarR family transcriptional regulator
MHDLSLRLRRLGERRAGLAPLPHSELEVLVEVLDHPQTTVTDVARALGLQTSNVSTTVHQLVDRGLVERVPNPSDRRSSCLVPTRQALADRETIDDAWAAVIGEFLDGLTGAQRATLLAATPLLRRLSTVMLDSRR